MRPDDISVVAGGWSFVPRAHHALPGMVIAVNDAAIHLEQPPNVVVSMDRLWTEYRWPKLLHLARPFWVRTAAIKNIKHWASRSFVHPFRCDNTTCVPSLYPDVLNGTNSGACALNLALKLHPRRLWLFGFDYGRGPEGQTYWYPPYPWAPKGQTGDSKYARWAKQLEPLAQVFKESGVSVTQVGQHSLPFFKHIGTKELKSCLPSPSSSFSSLQQSSASTVEVRPEP